MTPTIQTPEITGQRPPTGQQSGTETPGGGRTASTPGQSIAEVVRNEGRRDKVLGTGNPTEQTNITPQQLQQALHDAVRAGSNVAGDPLVDALSAVGGLLKDVAEAVLASGVGVGTGGVSVGGVGQSQDQFNQEVADSLAQDLGESFRSDVVPTLLGNQPGTVQPGSADPDDETAQAPAAVARVQLATEGTLQTLATESTLESVNAFVAQIAANTNILTQLPIIESLAGQGVSTEDAQSNLNLGERQTDLLTLLYHF